jgi:hypothetical protein
VVVGVMIKGSCVRGERERRRDRGLEGRERRRDRGSEGREMREERRGL